jgi:hypothetical protein
VRTGRERAIRPLGGGRSGNCDAKECLSHDRAAAACMGGVGRQNGVDSYLPSASISPSTATKRGTSPPEYIVKREEEEQQMGTHPGDA